MRSLLPTIPENEPGTNPEGLIAGAHAACFAMALANTLTRKGYKPESIGVNAACVLKKQEEGFAITRMELRARGVVPHVADVILFLASDAARAVTGAAAPVYGRS